MSRPTSGAPSSRTITKTPRFVDYFFQSGISASGSLADKRIISAKNSKRRRSKVYDGPEHDEHQDPIVEAKVESIDAQNHIDQENKPNITVISPVELEKVMESLSPSSGLRNSITLNSLVLSEKDHEGHPIYYKYHAEALSRYPFQDYSEDEKFPPYVSMFCFPNDLKFAYDINGPPPPSYHSFIITEETGAKTYGVCVTIWEKLSGDLKTQFENLVMKWRQENLVQSDIEYVEHVKQQLEENEAVIADLKTRVIGPNDEDSVLLLASAEEKANLYRELLRPMRNTVLFEIDNVYVPRAMGVLSHWPWYDFLKDWLCEVMDAVSNPRKSIANIEDGETFRKWVYPLERYVINLIHEIPLPPPGKLELAIKINDKVLRCSRPPVNCIPIMQNFSLYPIFRCLSPSHVITLFELALMERKILFVSSYQAMLNLASESLCNFLFPFYWHHIFIPILPNRLSNYLQAPMPYIIGVDRKTYDEVVDMNGSEDFSLPEDVTIVDLDHNIVHCPTMPPQIPYRDRKKLLQRLQKYTAIPDDPSSPLTANQSTPLSPPITSATTTSSTSTSKSQNRSKTALAHHTIRGPPIQTQFAFPEGRTSPMSAISRVNKVVDNPNDLDNSPPIVPSMPIRSIGVLQRSKTYLHRDYRSGASLTSTTSAATPSSSAADTSRNHNTLSHHKSPLSNDSTQSESSLASPTTDINALQTFLPNTFESVSKLSEDFIAQLSPPLLPSKIIQSEESAKNNRLSSSSASSTTPPSLPHRPSKSDKVASPTDKQYLPPIPPPSIQENTTENLPPPPPPKDDEYAMTRSLEEIYKQAMASTATQENSVETAREELGSSDVKVELTEASQSELNLAAMASETSVATGIEARRPSAGSKGLLKIRIGSRGNSANSGSNTDVNSSNEVKKQAEVDTLSVSNKKLSSSNSSISTASVSDVSRKAPTTSPNPSTHTSLTRERSFFSTRSRQSTNARSPRDSVETHSRAGSFVLPPSYAAALDTPNATHIPGVPPKKREGHVLHEMLVRDQFGSFDSLNMLCEESANCEACRTSLSHDDKHRALKCEGCGMMIHPDCINLLDAFPCPTIFRDEKVMEAFLKVFTSLLKNYRHYLVTSGANGQEPASEDDWFKTSSFLDEFDKEAKPFMSLLVETQAFTQFTLDRFEKPDTDVEVLFFDECVKAKLNRSVMKLTKEETPFLKDATFIIKEAYNVLEPSFEELDKAEHLLNGPRIPIEFDQTLMYTPRNVEPLVTESTADRIKTHAQQIVEKVRLQQKLKRKEDFSVWFKSKIKSFQKLGENEMVSFGLITEEERKSHFANRLQQVTAIIEAHVKAEEELKKMPLLGLKSALEVLYQQNVVLMKTADEEQLVESADQEQFQMMYAKLFQTIALYEDQIKQRELELSNSQ